MEAKELKNQKVFYMLGIGGVSMSALAKYLCVKGKVVIGYDKREGETTEELKSRGVTVFTEERSGIEAIFRADVVVYSDAIAFSNPLLCVAREAKKTILSRAELLSFVGGEFSNTIAIAGSHGKTTCTAMCAHALQTTGVPFCAHIGGEDSEFSNFYFCGEEYFVTEACEYKKNHLKTIAERVAVLNVDKDHMECYDGEEDLVNSFSLFCSQAKEAFVCADDEGCMRFGRGYGTFGIDNPHCDYRATALRQSGQKYAFTVSEYGKELCRIRLNTIGRHNVYNALAAFAVLRSYGFGEAELVRGLEHFMSVKRRFEQTGTLFGASVVCDYAHHPREIDATVKTAKRLCKGELYVVFQPHTYSRTRLLMSEFVAVLRKIKHLVVYKTYPAREIYDEEGSAQKLAESLGNCLYAETPKELKACLGGSVKEGDVVLFLGAGDIYYVARYLVRGKNKS